MAQFRLLGSGDLAENRRKAMEALKKLDCVIVQERENVIVGERKMTGASFWWTSPLMRWLGRISITIRFETPHDIDVRIGLNSNGNIFQVISILVFGAITCGIALVIFAFYNKFTDMGIKRPVQEIYDAFTYSFRI